MTIGTLSFFCGKMGAGKSTRAKEVASDTNAILISEDEWLAALYPDQITSIADYVEFSNRLKPQIKSLAISLLLNGQNVVLDFPANTPAQRKWFKSVIDECNAPHHLYYLNVSDEICLEQINKRRIEQPHRQKTDTKEMFLQMSKYFVAPHADEGLNIVL